MKEVELSPEVREKVEHIKGWQSLIRDDVATVLEKLYRGEELSRSEMGLDVTPSELAAIWSITNDTPIKVDHVRQVKRENRIEPSQEWGEGAGKRSLYKIRSVKDVRVSHNRGRQPKKVRKADQPAA